MNIPNGYCQCGCGQKTKIATQNSKRDRYTKGKSIRFCLGHANRKGRRPKYIYQGYIYVYLPLYQRSNSINGYVLEHIVTVETILGKPLPLNAVIHHANEIRSDNKPGNLIVCQDQSYHKLLHRRMRALKNCGHASWRKCKFCKQYGAIENMASNKTKLYYYHRDCWNNYMKTWRVKNGHA